ncbi:glycosyltransferase family 2 protein [Litchfieldella rifensis]|uniref:Glycosyltransferase family 2 protein n=1 Tax=Litchfieldella rifensis TaxID=762643 RepID=A0ABV7LTL5_9GAMM
MSVFQKPKDEAVLVSVVTPARNAAEHLPHTVASVASQGPILLEHIIIDDGSTDATAEVVKELQCQYPCIRYLYQPHSGAGRARNLGIEAATGQFIAFLDSDDLWLPGKLEAQIAFMKTHQVAFSFGDYEQRDRASGNVMKRHTPPDELTYRHLLNGCPIGCLTAAYDQSTFGKVYMPQVTRGQDWGLWLALTRMGGTARKYPGMRAVYHSGGGSLSTNKFAKVADIYGIYRKQEHLDHVRSGWYLTWHVLNSLLK